MKNVKEAKSMANDVKPNFKQAEQLVKEAMKNPETKDLADTWLSLIHIFFLRRLNICAKRSISLSLPTTGSNRPSSAAFVMSVPVSYTHLLAIPTPNSARLLERKGNPTCNFKKRSSFWLKAGLLFREKSLSFLK